MKGRAEAQEKEWSAELTKASRLDTPSMVWLVTYEWAIGGLSCMQLGLP